MSTSDAHAQSPSVAAEALFNEGRTLLDQGRLEEASDRFSRSEQLEPAAGTLFNLAYCYEHTHKLASAWGAYREAAALADKRSDPKRAAAARENADALEPKLAHLTITIDAQTIAIPGLTITRNGQRIDPAVFNAPIPVDRGSQKVSAVAPGYRSWESKLVIADGMAGSIRIPVLNHNNVEEVADTSNTQATVGFGLGIGGIVTLGAGLVFGGLTISKWSSVTDDCPNALCKDEPSRERHVSDVSTARAFAATSTVLTIVGVAALGTGIVLRVTAPPQPHKDETKAATNRLTWKSASPFFESHGGGLATTLTF